MTASDYMAPESVGRLQQRALVAGVVGLVACGICFFLYREQYADPSFVGVQIQKLLTDDNIQQLRERAMHPKKSPPPAAASSC